jgi:hypothetical protein
MPVCSQVEPVLQPRQDGGGEVACHLYGQPVSV